MRRAQGIKKYWNPDDQPLYARIDYLYKLYLTICRCSCEKPLSKAKWLMQEISDTE